MESQAAAEAMIKNGNNNNNINIDLTLQWSWFSKQRHHREFYGMMREKETDKTRAFDCCRVCRHSRLIC